MTGSIPRPEPSCRPIAVFDSGIGGLPYLVEARRELPSEAFAYAADRRGFPYGTKTRDEVRDRVLSVIGALVRAADPKAVVIACNTASQAALETAREAFPELPIIGTVPAVKPAAERTRSGVIGILATERTIRDPYLDELVARHAAGLVVIREAAQSLVEFVERRSLLAGEEERREAAAPFVRRLVDEGADEIVLACTHFLHLRDEIADIAGEGVEILDSRAGVVRHVGEVLAGRGLLACGEARGGGAFLLTGELPFEAEYGGFAARFGLEEPSRLEA
jgi:glutamate racemase